MTFAHLLAIFASMGIATAFVIVMGVFFQTGQLISVSGEKVLDFYKQVAKVSREIPVYAQDSDARLDRMNRFLARMDTEALVVYEAAMKLRDAVSQRAAVLATKGLSPDRLGTSAWAKFFDVQGKGNLDRVVVRS